MLFVSALRVLALGTLCSAEFTHSFSKKHALRKRQDLLDSVNSILYDAADTAASCVLAPLNTVITVAVDDGDSCDSLVTDLSNVVSDSGVEDDVLEPLSSLFNCISGGSDSEILGHLNNVISGVNSCAKKGDEYLDNVNTLCSNLVQSCSSSQEKCGKASNVATVTGVCGESLSSSSAIAFDSDNLLGDVSQLLDNTLSDLTGSSFSNVFGNLYDLVESIIDNLVSCNDVFKSLSSDISDTISQVESSSDSAVSEICPLLQSLINDLQSSDSSTNILCDINTLAGKIIYSTTSSASDSVEDVGSLVQKILDIISGKSVVQQSHPAQHLAARAQM